jgi:GTP-binding protein Era
LKDEAFFNKIIHAKIPVIALNKIDNSNQTRRTSGFLDSQSANAEIFQYLPCKTLMCQKFW